MSRVRRLLGCGIVGLALLGGCSWIDSMRPSKKAAQQHAQLVQTLQLQVMRFADEYAGREREAITVFQAGLTRPEDRLNAQRWKLQQAESVYQIASGPNAVTNALDAVVLATLSRMVLDDAWVTDLYGPRARPVQETYHSLEERSWQLMTGLLTETQLARLHQVINQWRADHPDVRSVAYIHFLDFAKAVGAPSGGEEGRPGNLFQLVGLNPLAGLDPAVQQITLTRELAERSIYYVQRMPDLLQMQVELLAYQSATMPETKALLSDVNRVSLIGSASDRLVSDLPGLLDHQRDALIRQLTQSLSAQSAALGTLSEQLRGTLQAGTDTANAVHGALDSVDKITSRFGPQPGAPPAPPGPPFDIRQYTAMLEQATLAAREINTLTRNADAALPVLRLATAETATRLQDLANHLFLLLVLLVIAIAAAALAAALAYRRLSARTGARA
jgi:hypothetical protein